MTINDSLDRAQKGLLDFFFPRKCPFCGRMTGRELLCSRCKTELPRCDKLRTGSFGECAAPLYYEDNVRKAILDFKFKNRVENLNCFGSLMAEKAAEVYSDRFDAVTWVPVSKKRLKKRGFDQARMLCASVRNCAARSVSSSKEDRCDSASNTDVTRAFCSASYSASRVSKRSSVMRPMAKDS